MSELGSVRKTIRIVEIDALRGIAVLAVLLFHYSAYYQIRLKGEDPFPSFDLNIGELGVDLFFIISGFVILLTAEKSKSVREFIYSRFIRLWPIYFICATITTICLYLYPIQTPPSLIDYLINLTLQPNLFKTSPIDGVYWSLFVEVQFYVFFAFLIYFNKIRQSEIYFSVFVLLCIIYQTVLLINGIDNFIHFYLGIIRHASLFLAGILCYRYAQSKHNIYLVGLALNSIGILTAHWMRKYSFDMMTHYISYWIFVLLFLYVTNNRSKILQNNALIFLGNISYPFYLIHMVVGFALMHYLESLGLDITVFVWGVILLVGVFSYLITTYFDNPIRKYLKKKTYQL